MTPNHFIFRSHAIRRMFERKISEADIKKVVEKSEVIEDYPEDTPYPSKLILGWSGSRPLHVVAENKPDKEHIIVTVYEPSLDFWEAGFKRRKQK